MLELKHKLFSSLVLFILDIIWIKFYMGEQYTPLVKKIQKKNMEVNKVSALLAYILMVIGLNKFVLPLVDLNNINFKNCLESGFLFGLIVYGVYDFTCGAVFKDWDFKLAIIDILWGGFVYFISCYSLKFIK